MASLRLGDLLVLAVAASVVVPSVSLRCTTQKFTNNKVYQHCSDLPVLGSYLHWSYDSAKELLSVAFVAGPPKPGGWVSWALNPTGTGMAGAQALIAYKGGNGAVTVKPYRINSYSSIEQTNLTYAVSDLSADASGDLIRLFATVALPKGTGSTVNQVWQVGPAVADGRLTKHEFQPANLNSKGTLDLTGGTPVTPTGGDSRMKKKNIHAVLNAVSWGMLFPLGVILARYLRTFQSADPAWFYLHVFCQLSAYVVGVAGWGTGLKLGSESKGIQYSNHRNLGIALFSLATVQVFALFLRPKKDHKYRFYWNIYHHSVGYAIVVLGIVNVFKGLDILDPEKKWKSAYIVVLAVLGVIALLAEALTWVVVLRRKSSQSTKPYEGSL